jgi:hypothetical protein
MPDTYMELRDPNWNPPSFPNPYADTASRLIPADSLRPTDVPVVLRPSRFRLDADALPPGCKAAVTDEHWIAVSPKEEPQGEWRIDPFTGPWWYSPVGGPLPASAPPPKTILDYMPERSGSDTGWRPFNAQTELAALKKAHTELAAMIHARLDRLEAQDRTNRFGYNGGL